MRKSAIAVQEISSGIAAAGDCGYNGLEFPRSATAATKGKDGESSPWTTGTIRKKY